MPATMIPRAAGTANGPATGPTKRYFKGTPNVNPTQRGESPRRPAPSQGAPSGAKGAFLDDAKILFQSYFKSVGPRTYAAQLKEVHNGNHVLVLTEGRRDARTGEVRKTKFLLWSEDFRAFFDLLRETAGFIKANPVPEEVRTRHGERHEKRGRVGGEVGA